MKTEVRLTWADSPQVLVKVEGSSTKMDNIKALKRNHHTVSRFYLNGFADGSKQVRRTSLTDPKRSMLVSTSKASVVKDFYLVPDKDGNATDAIESIFSEIESEGARAVRAIVRDSEWPIRLTTRGRIAAWVALQHLRTEGMRSIIEETIKTSEIPNYEMDYIRPPTRSVEHSMLIRNHLRVFTEEFFFRPWVIMSFEGITLATCDHPVIWGPASSEDDFSAGVYIPLSRHVGLLMGTKVSRERSESEGFTTDHQIAGDADRALIYNRFVVASAKNDVYTHPDDTELIASLLPSKPSI